jgi:hypothetical protein
MQRQRIHDAHTSVCANFNYPPLDQIDLFAGAVDTNAPSPSTANIKVPVTPIKSIYRVELMPDDSHRITEHGRVTFHGFIGRAKA